MLKQNDPYFGTLKIAALAVILMLPPSSPGALAEAGARLQTRAEGYYTAVLYRCYGGETTGTATTISARRQAGSVPIGLQRLAYRDWNQAVRKGASEVTAFCAHTYLSAVGLGFVRPR